MITKNINKIKETFTFNNVVDTFSMVNNFALATTENVALKGIKNVAKWQKTADKAIKKGLKTSAKNQDKMFDVLDNGKATAVKNVSKLVNKFSRN